MECRDVRERLEDLRRGRHRAGEAALRAHLESCRECARARDIDQALADLVARAGRVPAAPPHLRARVERALERAREASGPATRVRFFVRDHPWLALSLAAGLALALALPSALLLLWPSRPEPATLLIAEAVDEHVRGIALVRFEGPEVTEMKQYLRRLREQIEFLTAMPYGGDPELKFLGGRPTFFLKRKVAGFLYEKGEQVISLYVLPGAGIDVPQRDRVAIDRFKPMLTRHGGYSVFLWKQGDLAYSLVASLPVPEMSALFLKIRQGERPLADAS